MKLRVVKNTQSPNGNFTLTLAGEDGVSGELSLPVPPPEKEVFLYEVGQEFTLTAGPKPVKAVEAKPGEPAKSAVPAPPPPGVK
jgi:hypothetical protein